MASSSWMVNEKTTMFLRISFFDEDGDPTTPSDAWYRIDDVRSGTRIVPSVASPSPSPTADPDGMIPIPDLASVVDLEITPEQNARVAQTGTSEERVVTVEFNYDDVGGTSKHGTAEYRYWVKSLPYAT